MFTYENRKIRYITPMTEEPPMETLENPMGILCSISEPHGHHENS